MRLRVESLNVPWQRTAIVSLRNSKSAGVMILRPMDCSIIWRKTAISLS
ncbi:MAG: hypothetical protein SPL42_08270 [Bacteroidales bacterium]|nr:hypothetical protein [Bacteroidales bacterium]